MMKFGKISKNIVGCGMCLNSDNRVFVIQDNKQSYIKRTKEGAYHFNDVWFKGNYQYYGPSFKPIFKIEER